MGFFVLLILLFSNTLHEKYPDEFDNIAGGKLILEGKFPYTGFFTHHNPFAYYLVAFLLIFSGQSFVKFRLVLAMFYFLYHVGLYFYSKKRLGKTAAHVMLSWSILIGLLGTFTWGHMLLADSLAGLLFAPAVFILLFFHWKQIKLKLIDVALISLLLFLTLFTSITYIFAVFIGYLFLICALIKTKSFNYNLKNIIKIVLIFIIPYLIYFLHLLATSGLSDFYYQAIFFNQEYYVALPDGTKSANPLRFAISITKIFLDNFRAILLQVKDFNLEYPFAVTLALANALFIIALFLLKQWPLAAFILGVIIFSTARGNPLTTGNNDYQTAVYHCLSLFSGVFLVKILLEKIRDKANGVLKPVWYSFLFLFGVYAFFFTFYLFNNWMNKTYDKYMGNAPLIYDRPIMAPALNQILEEDDYYFIAPFAFEDHFYINAKLASKYFITIPAMDKSEKIQKELIQDLRNAKPKIIIFDRGYYIFNRAPGRFLDDYLQETYVTLGELEDKRDDIVARGTLEHYHLWRDIYIHADHVDEMIQKLEQVGWVELI